MSVSTSFNPEPSTPAQSVNRIADEDVVERRSVARLEKHLQTLLNRYRIEFGNHFNPDNAAELFEDYSSSVESRGKYRIAISRAAGALSDEAFKQRLVEADKIPVVFMAGGTASGKSTVAAPAAENGFIVFDSTFSNYELSKTRLQKALDSGRRVEVLYLYRAAVEAWEAARDRTALEGAGRVVTPKAHALTHDGAAKTVARLAVEFDGNVQVAFRYFANSTAAGLQPGGIELTAKSREAHIDSTVGENVPLVPSDMPAQLSVAEIETLGQLDLGKYLNRIAIAAVAQCSSNKDRFLKRYPRLDFRHNRQPG